MAYIPLHLIYDEIMEKVTAQFGSFSIDTLLEASRLWKAPSLSGISTASSIPCREYCRMTDSETKTKLKDIEKLKMTDLVQAYANKDNIGKDKAINRLTKILNRYIGTMVNQGIRMTLEGTFDSYDIRIPLYLAHICGDLGSEYSGLLERFRILEITPPEKRESMKRKQYIGNKKTLNCRRKNRIKKNPGSTKKGVSKPKSEDYVYKPTAMKKGRHEKPARTDTLDDQIEKLIKKAKSQETTPLEEQERILREIGRL